ncbi:MAG: hypothetical protein WC312_07320 [Candidatus Omnitrophota bacterium]|jgi:hypothetical protein
MNLPLVKGGIISPKEYKGETQMPISERTYLHDEQPPTCTCVACCKERISEPVIDDREEIIDEKIGSVVLSRPKSKNPRSKTKKLKPYIVPCFALAGSITGTMSVLGLWIFGGVTLVDIFPGIICVIGIWYSIRSLRKIKQKEKLEEESGHGNITAEDS